MDPTAELPEFLSLEGKIAHYAPSAEVSLETAVEMISEAIKYCCSNGIRGLLVDARQLYGFPHPTVVDRYWFIRKWAEDAKQKVVMAFVQRSEMIDTDQIGVTIASNAGLIVNVSDNEASARSWLLANIK